MKKLQKKGKGFVLLLVLAVLVIASTVLASWAYRLSSSALYAGEVSRDIQRKWAELSCRRAMLSSAEDILNEESKESNDGPVASAVREVKLCDMTYLLVLSDEQAKANVNFLVKNGSRQDVFQKLHRLISDMKNQPQIKLGMDGEAVEYTSLEQLFDCGDKPEKLMSIERLTCWGSGLLNFNRADKKTLEEVSVGVLNDTDIQNLLELRKEKPDGSLDELAKKLSLENKQVQQLKKILTDTSACQSLWIICQDETRKWYRFYVSVGESKSSDVKESDSTKESKNTPTTQNTEKTADTAKVETNENNLSNTENSGDSGTDNTRTWSYQW